MNIIQIAVADAQKEFLEKHNVEQVSELTDQQTTDLLLATNMAMAKALGDFAVEQAKAQSDNATAILKAENAKFEVKMQENTTALAQLAAKMANNQGKPISDEDARAEAVKASLDSLRNVMKSGGETEIPRGHLMRDKAVTTTASVTNNTRGEYLPDVGQLAFRRQGFLAFLEARGQGRTVPPNANGKIKYVDWDEATKVRAAAMRAEGAVFPESTAAWQEYSESLKEVSDMIPWTKEFQYDDAFLVQELQRFLEVNMRIIKGNQAINGDGVTVNMKGLITYCPTYTATASGVVDPSIYDLIPYLRKEVEEDQGSKYRLDMAVMNISDILKYKLKKDANNNYIMPPFVAADGQVIDGLTVIEDNNVAANTMFVGDSRFVTVHYAEGVMFEEGYINDDFSRGQKRMRGSERMLLLIRTVDQTGFLQVTSISAALTTLGT